MFRDQTLVKLDLPPGIVRSGTQYAVQGRWYDGNLVRWVEGRLSPVGGWQRLTTTALDGKARDMISWADNSGDRWIAIGTSTKLYATRADGTVVDITPSGFVSGEDDAVEGIGYGGGNYGADSYGTPRPGGTFFPLSLWSLDNWGENLVACARNDGKLYEWALDVDADAVAITNAPTSCLSLLVTDQRHVLALGAGGNPRKVQWSDKEANTVWTPAADNEAGSFELQTQSEIKAGVRVRGTNLILTATDAHAVTYVGQPFIYGRERIGADCGCPSGGSLVTTGDRAIWIGDGNFWESDGTSVRPLPCDVHEKVFGVISEVQTEKVVGGYNPRFGEVWWFLPVDGSTEPNRYVVYNVREGWWAYGDMGRTCWDSGSVFGFPFATGTDNHIYRHEDEYTDAGSSRYADIFVESGALEIGAGARIGHVDQLIPDEAQQGDVTVTFKTRFTPTGEEFEHGPYSIRADGYTDVRFAGRQATVRMQPTADGDFAIGPLRLNVRPGGRR